MRPFVLVLPFVCFASCAAVKEGMKVAVDAATERVDEKVGTAVMESVAKKDPELAKDLGKEFEERKGRGESFPWIRTILSNAFTIIVALLFGGTTIGATLKLRKRKPLKAISEILSKAIGSFTSKNGGGETLKTEIATAAKEHPEFPDGASVRETMKDAGATPGG
jgi:hypothetical protein